MKRNLFRLAGLISLVALLGFFMPRALGDEAPAAGAAAAEPAEEGAPVGDEVMRGVFERFGQKLPGEKSSQSSTESQTTETGQEQKTPQGEAETPEAKAEREAAEAAEAERLAHETPEEKAAREEREKLLANETPEEKAAREKLEAEAGETKIEFTEEQVSYLEAQLAEKMKESTAALEAAQAKVAELEAQVQTLGSKPGPVPITIHPLFLADSMTAIVDQQQKLNAFKEWAMAHFDGYEATKEGERSYSKEEVRATLAQVEKELTQILPAAARNLQAREQYVPLVKAAYPALLDPKSAEFKTARSFINNCPAIKVFPDHMLLIGDSLVGEKIRLAKNKNAKPGVSAAGKKTVVVVKKTAPKLPVGARPGPQSQALLEQKRLASGKGAKGRADVAGYVKGGADRASLVATVAKML